jgi:hypothetical protein
MADYTLHLGYNWNGTLVGSIWGRTTSDYRFLDYALADEQNRPWWFQFLVNDNLYVRLWDLSSSAAPPAGAWLLNMSLGPLDAGSTQTYNPSTYMSLNGSASVETRDTNPYLQLSSFRFTFSPSDPVTSPWGPARGLSNVVGPLTFTGELAFKLSFYLAVTVTIDGDRDTRVFISDPETRIGSGRPG